VTFSELRETCELDNRELRSFLHHALVCRLQSERSASTRAGAGARTTRRTASTVAPGVQSRGLFSSSLRRPRERLASPGGGWGCLENQDDNALTPQSSFPPVSTSARGYGSAHRGDPYSRKPQHPIHDSRRDVRN
jgi:hypothetical protein